MIRKRLRLDITVSDDHVYYERRSTEYVRRESFRRYPEGKAQAAPATSPVTPFMDVRPPLRRSQATGVAARTVHATRPKRSTKLIAKRPTATESQPVRTLAQAAPVPVEIPGSHEPLPKRRGLKRHITRQNTLYALALIVFVVGVAASLNGFRTNKQVAAQVSHQAERGDDSSSAPATAKPSAKDVSSYAVAPTLPRYIDIKTLGVHARVFPMSVTSKNQLRAPSNVHDAGWYNASSLPGQPGAMLVDGHVSSWETNGVFHGLEKLAKGDLITITRGDGKTFTYVVTRNEKYDAGKVDMSALMVSDNTAKPGLNIITCAGDVKPGTNEFEDRQVVYAVQQ